MKKNIGILCILLVAGCNPPPPAAPIARQDAPPPAISTEAVTMSLATHDHLARLSSLVMSDPPTRAEIGCAAGGPLCMEARKILATSGIPVSGTTAADVRLIYEYRVFSEAPPPAAASELAPSAAPPSGLPRPSLLLQSTPR